MLYGQIVDTNTPHLATRLFEEGYHVGRHVCVGDDEEAIAAAIDASFEEGAWVVATGGLGPTPDDRTREALSMIAGTPLVRVPELEERVVGMFRKRGIPMPESNLRQAELPQGARYISQKLGTAPGLIVETPRGTAYALPGVPHEMKEMLERGVFPDLRQRRPAPFVSAVKTYKVWGATEAAVAEALEGIVPTGGPLDPEKEVSLAFLPSTSELSVRIVARGASRDEATRRLQSVSDEVRARLGEMVFGEDSDTLPGVIGERLTEMGLTLAAAESLTGGMLGARLTSVPGASRWFKGSAVTYMAETKTGLLGIDPQVVETHGVVSARCAEEMACAARRIFGSDIGIACTGEAGPRPQEGEVGTVFMAVAIQGHTRSMQVRLPGDRERIRAYTVTTLLDFLRRVAFRPES